MGNEVEKKDNIEEKDNIENIQEVDIKKEEASAKQEQPETKQEPDKKDKKASKKKVSAAEYDKLAADLNESKEQFLRLRAEYDNFRKRTQAEKTLIYNNALSDAVKAILPSIDNIDRALEQKNSSAEDMFKGVQMISNQFKASLKELGVKEIGEKGEPFDPNKHNAVAHIEDDTLEQGVISQVLQKGYSIGDRVIRHAMVQVAN